MALRSRSATPSASSVRTSGALITVVTIDSHWSAGPTSLRRRPAAVKGRSAAIDATYDPFVGDARDPASLGAALPDGGARRQAAAGSDDAAPAAPVAMLPGVGGDDVRLRSVLDEERGALLVTVGCVFALGLAVFGVAAILAIKVAHHYDWSFRF